MKTIIVVDDAHVCNIVHCSMLAEDAIKAAVANYKAKKIAAGIATQATNLSGTGKMMSEVSGATAG
jgi:hypothetical protein